MYNFNWILLEKLLFGVVPELRGFSIKEDNIESDSDFIREAFSHANGRIRCGNLFFVPHTFIANPAIRGERVEYKKEGKKYVGFKFYNKKNTASFLINEADKNDKLTEVVGKPFIIPFFQSEDELRIGKDAALVERDKVSVDEIQKIETLFEQRKNKIGYGLLIIKKRLRDECSKYY